MKNKRAIILLFIANAISGFAQGISMLAIPWHFAIQGQSSKFNYIYAAVTFLTLFWSLYAGTIVDRFNRRNVFLSTNALGFVILTSIAGFGWINGSVPVPLIALAFITTIFSFHIHFPNLYAFAQEITAPRNYKKITSYIEIVGQSTAILSGACAAILLEGLNFSKQFILFGKTYPVSLVIEKWELYQVFTLDGITYFIAALVIIFIKYVPYRKTNIEKGTLIKRLRSGFAYLWKNPSIFIFGLFSYAIFIVLLIELFALLPAYINNHLHRGADVLGISDLIYAIGALLAGFLVGKTSQNINQVKSVIILILATTAALFLLSVTRNLWVFYLVAIIMGFCNSGTRIFRITYLFNYVPNEVIGRVNSIFGVANITIRFSFILLFSLPFFSQGSNVRFGYAFLAAFTLLSAIILMSKYRKLVKGE
ncbi:MAG: MFS transporter [Bacteroidetes bacterium]|nr:MFS transporter [Bacteroidota bacterium]